MLDAVSGRGSSVSQQSVVVAVVMLRGEKRQLHKLVSIEMCVQLIVNLL